MGFPTTVQEVLALTPEEAEGFLERIDNLLMKHSPDWVPPEDVLLREANYSLAMIVDVLNHCNGLADNPLGPDWTVHLTEEEAQES